MQTFMIDAFKNYLHGRMVLLIVLISAVVMIFYSERTYQQSVKKLAGLVEVTESRAQILNLRKYILDAETGQRGYLLTGRVEYLTPYNNALGPIREHLESLNTHYAGQAPTKLVLDQLRDRVNACIAMGRSIIEDLRPSTLSNLGMVAALEILAREFTQSTGVAAHCALTPVRLAVSSELVVYRLVQEALTNITKYAKAQQVWGELAAQDGLVRVTVRDNGIGFDTSAQPASAYGLVGMHYRIEAERGQLSVLSAPGQGTTIQAYLPESV